MLTLLVLLYIWASPNVNKPIYILMSHEAHILCVWVGESEGGSEVIWHVILLAKVSQTCNHNKPLRHNNDLSLTVC